MVIGILQVELTIDAADSLKDKRRVVKSLKDRLHREHQVSVAEVGTQDVHRTATLGMVVVSTEVPHCQGVLDGFTHQSSTLVPAHRPGVKLRALFFVDTRN